MIFSLKKAAFLFVLLFPATQVNMAVAAATLAAPAKISASDFSVKINNHLFSLGEKWSDQVKKQAGEQLSENFVGDVPAGDMSYKYYQHQFDGFEIYTANLFWQQEKRDIDSYLIAQISINTPTIETARGIKIGDTQATLISKYGQGTTADSDNQHWLYYDADNKRISFQLEHEKISHVMMTLNTDN